MRVFAERLRERSHALGLSDAEVARRAGIGQQRYAHYVADRREPDLATLLRVCEVLAATPNELLGIDDAGAAVRAPRAWERLIAAVGALGEDDRAVITVQAEALVRHRQG